MFLTLQEAPMQRLTEQILEQAAKLPEGASVSAKELLHLGTRAAVDQALSRLARRGRLMRAGRGLYVQAIAGAKGEVIASHGATAANALGLTTQVPVRAVYLTSGRTRKLKIGKQTVELRHAPRWQLAMAGRPAGEAIRALAWLGEEQTETALRTLQRRLPSGALQEIVAARPQLPTWLAEQVSRLVVNG
jgi:Family of unknown function (DUF6088)